jgi:glycosyltransferase involved in cell wall biosynthesis
MLPQLQAAILASPLEAQRETIHVLHVVESLDNQAVESWLLRVLRAAASDYSQIKWTFFTTQVGNGKLDETARELGAEVIHSQYEIGEKIRFVRSLREVMKRGRYDILHCHHDVMSALYLLAAKGLPFQKRIVHVHNTSLSLPTPNRLKANLAREPMRQMCLRMADEIVGISREALASMVGEVANDPLRHRVVHYAVDTERFEKVSQEAEQLRESLGFRPTTKLLLFVGRMVAYKNPCFIVNMLEYLVEMLPDVAAVFAGSGDQETEVRELAKRKSLEDHVRLLGFRQDVPALMLASDLLVWPSFEDPKEGLGLGIVEAQAASLPILMSQSVPEEAIVIAELVKSLPLAAGPRAWAETARERLKPPRLSLEEALRSVEGSSFSMAQGVASLMKLYAVPR